MTRKTITVVFVGLFLVALSSTFDFGYKLYRWHLLMDKLRGQLHGGPMVGMPFGFGRFIPLDARLFWVSLAVAILSLTVVGALYFSDHRTRHQNQL